MKEDALFREMVMGGRGQCPKCLRVVNNVAYHMEHDCAADSNQSKNGVSVRIDRSEDGSIVNASCACFGHPARVHSNPDCPNIEKPVCPKCGEQDKMFQTGANGAWVCHNTHVLEQDECDCWQMTENGASDPGCVSCQGKGVIVTDIVNKMRAVKVETEGISADFLRGTGLKVVESKLLQPNDVVVMVGSNLYEAIQRDEQ